MSVGDIRAALQDIPAENAVDPETLWALAAQQSLPITLTLSHTPGCFDALLGGDGSTIASAQAAFAQAASAQAGEAPAGPRSLASYANQPQPVGAMPRLAAAVRRYLAETLPTELLPAEIVVLNALPLTSNGKVDRRTLAALGREPLVLSKPAAAPSTTTEVRLAQIWEELLEVPNVGAEDDFFALGGHSLLAARLITRIADAFQVHLPFESFLTASSTPTVRSLAATIERYRWAVAQGRERAPDEGDERVEGEI